MRLTYIEIIRSLHGNNYVTGRDVFTKLNSINCLADLPNVCKRSKCILNACVYSKTLPSIINSINTKINDIPTYDTPPPPPKFAIDSTKRLQIHKESIANPGWLERCAAKICYHARPILRILLIERPLRFPLK